MRLLVKRHDISSSEPMVLLHEYDCRDLGVSEGERVRIIGKAGFTALVSMSDTLIERGEIHIPDIILEEIRIGDGKHVEVMEDSAPDSVRAIMRKMEGENLTSQEIESIVADVMDHRLSSIEVGAWLTSLHIHGMDMDETAAYTIAMSRSGGMLDFDGIFVLDFHSFGGIPGNKITPIVVSIVAAAGHTIPKLSSRAISSACGTADFVETFCDIDLDDADILRISSECGGTFSWTGSTDLGPAGDVFIRYQRPLGIDPRPQMLASIMGKKVAAGASAMLMDIPTGPETKVRSEKAAMDYVRDLTDLGERIGVDVECVVTHAHQPLGHAIGPILEARECMQTLESRSAEGDVAEKAILCAGTLLRMAGDMNGLQTARSILESGRAHDKFLEIVAAQGGEPDIDSTDMASGALTADIRADSSGVVSSISNKAIVAIAKASGAPNDKGAGLYLHRKCGDAVKEGDVLFTIHADKADKLEDAVEVATERRPFTIE